MSAVVQSVRYLILGLLGTLAVAATSCGGTATPAAVGIEPESDITTVVTASATATLPAAPVDTGKPAIGIIALPPQLPTAIATITRPVPIEPTNTALPIEPSITPTATDPPPTFTPPPPPPDAPGEHLIFGRPVPESATQWTDKAYPYGSTRGGTLQPHHGVEFSVPTGTPVLAAASGTIRVAGADDVFAVGPETNFYGNVIVIEHDTTIDGLPVFTLYGHLSEVDVTVGQRVAAQEQIGLSGETGIAYGPHLHFEVREGINSYLSTRNPLLWLRPFAGTGIVAALVTFPNGQPANEVPVTLRRVDGSAPYTASTSYALAPVNGDGYWGENFAVDDVVAGYYEISAGDGRNTTTQTLWVFPGRTNFITLALP